MSDSASLSLRWCIGFNSGLSSSVHSLSSSDTGRHAIFYPSAHTGVIHDLTYDTQLLLQGHCNAISCVCVSRDKRWLVTADRGPDSLVIVWDSIKAAPVKIFSTASTGGVLAMDLSSDACFLATLSASEPQELAIWEWPAASSSPLMVSRVSGDDSGEFHTSLRFNPGDVRDLVSNGPNSICFWRWFEGDRLQCFPPSKGFSRLASQVKRLTGSAFIPNSSRVVSATASGHIVAWDFPATSVASAAVAAASGSSASSRAALGERRDAVKILKLVKSGIESLSTVEDKYLCLACSDGAVRFFDFQFRVVAWFEDLHSGPIKSVSFADGVVNGMPKHANEAANNAAQSSAAASMEEFSVCDFVVSTEHGSILALTARAMDQLNPEQRAGKLLVSGFAGAIRSLAAHPQLPIIAIGTARGAVQIWNYEDRKLIAQRVFGSDGDSGSEVSAVRFSPRGDLLAVGFSSGALKLLSLQESNATGDLASFHQSTSAISRLEFSSDGQFCASADGDHCVGLYRFTHREDAKDRHSLEWVYIGKYRAHKAAIVSLLFEQPANPSTGARLPRLLSVSADRVMQEFDLAASSIRSGLALASSRAVDQLSQPTAAALVPPRVAFGPSFSSRSGSVLLIANSDYKLKVWSDARVRVTEADAIRLEKRCDSTFLAPTYGQPIAELFPLPSREAAESPFLVYSTGQQLIGLIKAQPMDGNPNNSMAVLAHPGPIAAIAASFDGQFIISAGQSDGVVNLWQANPAALQAAAAASGDGLDAFLSLLDGGASGDFYNSLLDYFYYSQLRTQGLHTTEARSISGSIPVSEAIRLMQALGFFPTNKQIQEIKREVRVRNARKQNKEIEESDQTEESESEAEADLVTLEEFIRLYINHRPVLGLHSGLFDSISRGLSLDSSSLDRSDLLLMLTQRGEAMSTQEINKCLDALLGDRFVAPQDPEAEDDSSSDPALAKLPRRIDLNYLRETLLGLQAKQ